MERREVAWRINIRDAGRWHEVIRREKGRRPELIGGSTSRHDAIGIAEGDRIRVLYDPLTIEVRPLEYRTFTGISTNK